MTTQQWVNTDDDGAMHALLSRLCDRVAVDAIDTLWLFSTRRAIGIESTVCVISAFDIDSADRRRVGAVRWLVTRDRKGQATIEEEVHEYATAPADAVPRVVDGVLRRIGADALETPRAVEVGGDAQRWADLLRELGAPAPTTHDEEAAEEVAAAEALDDAQPDSEGIPDSEREARTDVVA